MTTHAKAVVAKSILFAKEHRRRCAAGARLWPGAPGFAQENWYGSAQK
ncbi:hypothetical protein MES5069_230121 [Mesorhizobium escarrei]|uniref:Uncharacterized protein n=1 Tax=Mesorhizobium escarrei TaxID=666018 RepID=A0ABM9DSP1_9HYPH|nr:hypothetical protein MES5069_230121 [Mesorhizobium escarrei]